ncbi:phosphoenolpyruvate--protein phosphotransferase [Rhodococcus pyridinivorans]|uniref:phosphoenolpyruvate--protein phosphotransferase n=1 Tax=Rhodococcus pyridinivorans TaxID=103816 RepID=UPI00280B15A3|nr:phosphoenolpyruvate--protein phosphotransferase [Rhodococcus pyridinivorans]WMM74590.1 phosphoenolpyruvate--protein phosphotransferase [Rhodococcus pyridinivorans]
MEQSASVLYGTPVVPGIGYGPVIRPVARPVVPAQGASIPDTAREAEVGRFEDAAKVVAERLRARASRASGAAAEVLQATAVLVEDRAWRGATATKIRSGSDAVGATVAATDQFAALFEKMGGLQSERVTDLLDIRDRVIAELQGAPEPGLEMPDSPSVLLAADLAPADTAGLDPSVVVALATSLGGPTSHTAIIARQLGIPCVVAVAGLDDIPAGTEVLVDGATGRIVISPDSAEAAAEVDRDRVERERVAGWSGPGATADGHPVEILANVQDGSGARAARRTPAQGVGLFRTELCFLDRDTEPTVDEQADIYAEVFEAFEGRKVVLRTLDAGSDKPLRFANHPDEHNPALGVRGIRITTTAPGVLDRQLDAVAAAASRTGATPWVMAPMVATVSEAADFAARVRERGLSPGVMIEVPSAALLADRLLEHLDFLSIGTNDLAQYTMAADRMSPQLAALTDPWQPAVLALVARAAQAGAAASKPVGVCGEAAADPLLACVLTGMGVTSLSCAASAVTGVGARLSSVPMDRCREAAEAVLASDDPVAARAAAAKLLD